MKKCSVSADRDKNLLVLLFVGIISPREIENIYTDVRFFVADLSSEYSVIADFSKCKFMYLKGLKTFKKIFHYMISNNCGEIIRVIQQNRIISKQIINYTLAKPGYKPTYLPSRELAEQKIKSAAKRNALRFQLTEKPVEIIKDDNKFKGFILNISTSGCAISPVSFHPKPLDVFTLKFTLKAPNATRDFTLETRVVRVESYTFAVQFLDIPDSEITILKACIIKETEDSPI